jgi:hypothetical protein
MEEGIKINKGLHVLGKVIEALTDRERVPYRESMLTKVLQVRAVLVGLQVLCRIDGWPMTASDAFGSHRKQEKTVLSLAVCLHQGLAPVLRRPGLLHHTAWQGWKRGQNMLKPWPHHSPLHPPITSTACCPAP